MPNTVVFAEEATQDMLEVPGDKQLACIQFPSQADTSAYDSEIQEMTY